MKTIVLTFAAMAVAFAQTPATKAPEKTPAAPTAKVARKHSAKHVKKAETGKMSAVPAAAPAVK